MPLIVSPTQSRGDNAASSVASINTSATGLALSETSSSRLRTIEVTGSATVVSVTDGTNLCYGSLKLFDFPEGALVSFGGVMSVTAFATATNLAGLASATSGQVFVALGSVAAANDNDLTSTEADIIPKTSTGALTSGATTATFRNTTQASVAAFAGQATATACYLNIGASIDGTSSGTIAVTFTAKITYLYLGDN